MKLIVFDLDGVIIDSIDVMRKAYIETCHKLNLYDAPAFSDYKKHLGKSLKKIILELGLPNAFRDHYIESSNRLSKSIQVFDGIQETIKTIKKETNANLGIATGKEGARARKILRQLGLFGYFDMVIGGDVGSRTGALVQGPRFQLPPPQTPRAVFPHGAFLIASC